MTQLAPTTPPLGAFRRGPSSSEFWLASVMAGLSFLQSIGILGEGSLAAQIVGLVVSGLVALGYGGYRTYLKAQDIKAQAVINQRAVEVGGQVMALMDPYDTPYYDSENEELLQRRTKTAAATATANPSEP